MENLPELLRDIPLHVVTLIIGLAVGICLEVARRKLSTASRWRSARPHYSVGQNRGRGTRRKGKPRRRSKRGAHPISYGLMALALLLIGAMQLPPGAIDRVSISDPIKSAISGFTAGGAGKLAGPVTHVCDGDTVEVAGVPIRRNGLTCDERGTPLGDRATAAMHSLVSGREVS